MSELRDIMEKRRRKAEHQGGQKKHEHDDDDEGSLSELPSHHHLQQQQQQQQHGSSAAHQFHGSARSWDPHSSIGSAAGESGGGGMMSPDLKAAMERRRRLADATPDLPRIDTGFASPTTTGEHPTVISPGSRTDAAASPVKSELKTVAMGADLQAIMARRRKMAGGSDDEKGQDGREKASVVAPDLSEGTSSKLRGSRSSQSHSKKPEGSPIKQDSSHSTKGGSTSFEKRASTSTSPPSRKSQNKSTKTDEEKNETSASRPSLGDTLATKSPSKSRRKKSDDSTSKSSSTSPRKPSRRLKSRAGSSDEQSVDISVASSGSSDGRNTRSSSNAAASSAASAVDSPTKRSKKKRASGSRKLSGGGTSSGEDKPSTSSSSKAHRSKKLPPTSTSSRPKATSSGEEDAPPKPVRRSRSTDNSAGDTALTKPRRSRSTRGMNEEASVSGIEEPNKEEPAKDKPVAKKEAATATAATIETGWGSDFATFGSPGSAGGAGDTAAFGSGNDAFGLQTFAATDANGSSDAFHTAFGGSPNSNDAFGNFDQAAFSSLANKSLSRSDFEGAFSPSAFESGNAFDAFGTKDSATFDSVFSSKKEIKKKPEKVWDKSPLTGKLPKRAMQQLVLRETPVFAAHFSRPPVTNPLNGNILFCCRRKSGLFLQEVDPRRGNVQISCTPVLSSDFKRKIGDKYKASAHRVDYVISLAAGLHHANGQARVRVAAILDVAVLESAQILRILAVWQWGYGAGSLSPIALQHCLAPPSSGNFIFDASSLQTADGLLFLAGASPDKGPCLFMSKPSVKETWSANFLGASGRITSMAVAGGLKRSYPYLAIGLSDGSLSIWTYDSALSAQQTKDTSASGPAKRWLFPLCRLDHTKWSDGSKASRFTLKDIGFCTGLEWLPPQPTSSSMLLLAAAFQNGLAVFNVDLPVTKVGSKPLSQGTGLSLSPLLPPIMAKRWQDKHEKSCVSWIDLGPPQGFSLAVMLLQDSRTGGAARVLFGTMALSSYRKSPVSNNGLIPFRVIASKVISAEPAMYPASLLRGLGTSRVYASSETHVIHFSLRDNNGSEALSWALSRPVASQPMGLNASGDPLYVDSEGDKDGVLHLFSIYQCDRKTSNEDEALLVRGTPLLRRWLVRTAPGDTKYTADTSELEEKKTDRGFGSEDQVSSGAVSQLICEIFHENLEGLAPLRIARCLSRSVCAIAFRDAVGHGGDGAFDASLDAKAIAFVDYSTGRTEPHITVIRARDVVFFPQNGSKEPCGLLLSEDGSRITHFEFNTKLKKCVLGSSFRPMIGVDVDKDFVECRRFFVFSGADKIVFAAVGTGTRANQSCFVIGNLVDIAALNSENFSLYLPNVCTDRICWFEDKEEIVSIIGLEADDSGYRNFATSTSSRVLILSSALQVSAEIRPTGPFSNLAPLGPFSLSYFSQNKFHYLCSLDGKLASGTFCTLPSRKHGFDHNQLVAVRPDRVLLLEHHVGSRQIELGQNPNVFLLPTATTLPALLLEPLVANAVCVGGKQNLSTPILRTVIEKFGRVTSITHGEDEGIGRFGSGLTPRTFEILDRYGLKQASSWLLTGTVSFDRGANSVVLPPWLPVAPKMMAGLNFDAFFHVISTGDQYLSDYLRSPDKNMPTTLPKQSGPAAYWCREYANQNLRNGRGSDALKLLDLAGGDATETMAVQLALSLGKDKTRDPSGFLKTVSGYSAGTFSGQASKPRVPTSIAALATLLKESVERDEPMSKEQIDRWMKPLAPSLQRGCRGPRIRQRVVGEQDLVAASGEQTDTSDPIWLTPCVEAKHVWNEGPRREKEHLLMLDRMEDWIGRRRPLILGKEGVSAALDRGEKTLADLLNQDDDSFGDKSDLESEKDDWVEGVGEGRSDEANLVAYFRMSEGEDEDSPWKSDGLSDITAFQNKAIVVGDAGSFSLQPSTSSVDEGEPGKVKSLYDVVFEKKGIGLASGLAIPASRGSSLDVGALLGPERQSRKRCSIEFWYYLPPADSMWEEMVLARRTLGDSADDLSKVCLASDKESVLWDLCLLKTGEIVFRTCSGAVLSSTKNYDPNAVKAAKETPPRHDLAVFERWNHICIVLSSKGLGVSDCNVSICMKGNDVASSQMSMLPPSYDENDLEDTDTLNGIIKKSHILFGLDHGAGFRMTEIRVWACERSADDTQSFLYEYLTAAEAKKKFKVKISQKKGVAGKGGLLAPPKVGSGGPTRGFLATTKSTMVSSSTLRGSAGFSLAPEAQKNASVESASASFDTAFGSAFNQLTTASEDAKMKPEFSSTFDKSIQQSTIPEEEEIEGQAELWDTALPLSKQVRSSAAAALIRGPPATRHFGGNRGGLPDFSGMDRFGVGGIAICGSEKTIVWRDNEDPPALTYPIGASGAIVSDQMDDMGSEFLCCFLAKEKRMVVFELQSRTVVVELQMTTKLNFWRYLPPEAAENTLCFILITPVGGFHWMPLEESPRPHQVWKRGPSLQGKKVVNYEEGGSNGLDGSEVRSRVGLVMVTKASGAGSLESWVIPIAGDSKAVPLPSNVLGACFCQPPFVDSGAFLPLVVTVHENEGNSNMVVNVLSVLEPEEGSIALGGVEATQVIEMEEYVKERFEPPALAMGTLPEVICCSLSNILVVIVRRKGVIAAYELEDDDLSLIAQEGVGHYVVDAVMRYSAEVGLEIVLLLSDNDNPKDGRIVSFCFRSAA